MELVGGGSVINGATLSSYITLKSLRSTAFSTTTTTLYHPHHYCSNHYYHTKLMHNIFL